MDSNGIIGDDLKRYFENNAKFLDFVNRFPYNEGDDRAIVIIGASFLETLLERILLEFLPSDGEVEKLLGYDNVLGTYGNKARMLYCLGLIEKSVYEDLKLIGKIRNRFAHDFCASFDDANIKSWCVSLKWYKISLTPFVPADATTRDLYQVGLNQVITYLNGIPGIARNEKRKIIDNFSNTHKKK